MISPKVEALAEAAKPILGNVAAKSTNEDGSVV